MTLFPVFTRVLAALCCCFLSTPLAATAKRAPPTTRPTTRQSLAPIAPEALYARRALRRARLIVEMRLLEFRKERLECVRQAILRNLPPDLRPVEEGSKGARQPDPETCVELLR